MYRLFDTPIREYTLPEGYSFSHFVPGADVHAWCECLRGGNLIDSRTDEEAYRDEIVNFKDIVPENDIWFLDYNGEHIGTAHRSYTAPTTPATCTRSASKTASRERDLQNI